MTGQPLYDFLADDSGLLQILSNTRAGVYVADLDLRLLYANESLCRLLRVELADITGKTLLEIFPDNGEQYSTNARQVLGQEKPLTFEETFHNQDRKFSIVSQKFPLRDRAGNIYGVGGISSDITNYLQREATLYQAGINVSSLSTGEVYEDVVKGLVASLNVDLAFIGKLKEGSTCEIVTSAVCLRGEIMPQLEYELEGTPCKTVIGNNYRFIPSQLTSLYPGDGMVVDLNLEAYAGYPMFDSAGRALGMVAICHSAPLDQPELFEAVLKIYAIRVAAELEIERSDRALQASEEQYHGIFNASADALMFWSNQQGLVDINPAAEALYGYDRTEFLALEGQVLMPADNAEHFEKFANYALDGTNFKERATNRRKDGTTFSAEVHGVHMLYQGEPHLLTIVRDISEQVAQENALISSSSRLRATLESALDCVICMDANGCIIEFNHSAELTFGYQRQQVMGRQLADILIPERFRARHREGLARFVKQGDSRVLGRRIEVTAQRCDGSEFCAELAINYNDSPNGRFFIGYLRDLTEKNKADESREQLESQLRQAQKMEAIGHLTGGIAHDFNNLLTSLMGYVSMAEEHGQTLEDEKLQRYMSRARRSGEKARDLIQQMLTFSRGQRGEAQPTQLQSLLREFLSLLESTLTSSIEITTHIDDSLPSVTVDPVHIEQVLMNLCINARDAMGGAGELSISLARGKHQQICSSCQQNIRGEFIELTVGDNGPGIEAATINRMFEPFFTTKEVGKGSGMGLAMVHGIVHEYGGHLLVDTRPGNGTSFRILLPCEEGLSSAETTRGSGVRTYGEQQLQGQVLLVDDEPSVAEYMQDLLESWGLEVCAHQSGRAALQQVQTGKKHYQIAILDQTMAHMSGLELARKLREENCNCPIIIYTGYSEIDRDLAASDDILALMAKPVDTQQLHSLLRDNLVQANPIQADPIQDSSIQENQG
jgi:PAS domain S-box-containing protein